MVHELATDADVLVVGCGPVGIMAALRCAQRGLSVIAVDRDTQVYPLPRAIGMDAEVQDLFARAGIIDELRANSTEMLGGEFVDASGNRVVGFDRPPGSVGPLGHPPMVSFDQPSVERFLRDAALAAGVDLRLGVELVGLAQTANVVAVELGDGSSLSVRWVVGADGAKSTVRDLVGINLIDQQFDQTWLVVDTTLLDPGLALPIIPQQNCDPQRIVTFVPGHDMRRRWEFQLKPGETREQALEPSFLAELLSPWGTPDQLHVDRVAVYRFHATVAERFRSGSVFLAGDAAHQMPPFNGQGMCSGMRDAENLAWKLAAVNDDVAGELLLATYDQERRPHATQQVEHSVDAGKLIEAIAHDCETALESGYGRRGFPKLEHGIIDNAHPFGGMPLPRPNDDAFTISDGWTLLQREHAPTHIPELWQQLGATVHPITNTSYGDRVDADATVIVRPDRFVAAVTNDLAATTVEFKAMITAPLSTSSPKHQPNYHLDKQ